MCYAASSTPTSYLQARQSNEWDLWNGAIPDELANMVWEVVSRNAQRFLRARAVFTRKIIGETGQPDQ